MDRDIDPYTVENGYILTLTRRDTRRGGLIRSLTWHPTATAARAMQRALNPGLIITAGPAIVRESELTGRDAAEIARYRRARETICRYTVPEA